MTRFWNPRRAALQAGAAPRALFDDAVMMLEERVMLDAEPVVAVGDSNGDGMTTAADNNIAVTLNTTAHVFTTKLIFDNIPDSNGVVTQTTGYGPFIELIVPQNGSDGSGFGAADKDGISFANATYLGQALTTFTAQVKADGTAVNGLTGQTETGLTPGDQLVILQLPFGSFTNDQTPAEITASFRLSPNADLGTTLNILSRGGFEYGRTPNGVPGTDTVLQPTFTAQGVTPTLLTIAKTSNTENNPEEEVATGPNQPYQYTINVDIADGQRIDNLVVTDTLPDTFFYQGIDSVTVNGVATAYTLGAGSIVIAPMTSGTLVPVGGAPLIIQLGSVTAGNNSVSDVQIKLHGYVNDVHSDGTPVIPSTYGNTTTDNNVKATYDWVPVDVRDTPVTNVLLDPVGPENTIQNQPITIQKTTTLTTDTGAPGLSPGDVVTYTLNVQVSDYFSLGAISIADVLSDGQRLDTSFTPTLSVIQQSTSIASGSMLNVAVAGGEFTGDFASTYAAGTGITNSIVNISSNMIYRATHAAVGDADGILQGGKYAGANLGATTMVLTFRAIVQPTYVTYPAGHTAQLDQGDKIGNNATISAQTYNDATHYAVTDDATTSRPIATGDLIKTIVAINGVAPVGTPTVKVGDQITFQLEYDLPITSFEDLTIRDFLPLPVLPVTAALTHGADGAGVIPASGTYAFDTAQDTFQARVVANGMAGGLIPTVTFSPAANGNWVQFDFGDYSDQQHATKIFLRFTTTVVDSSFADGLFLTNLATSSEGNTLGATTIDNSIKQFQLAQPNLDIQKAYVSATHDGASGGTFTPANNVAGLTFLAPGTLAGGKSFVLVGTLDDTKVGETATAAASNLNANVTALDGSDTARVAIVVNNRGAGSTGAFDATIADALPTGITFLGGAAGTVSTANLVVARGDGTLLTLGTDYTITTSTTTGFTIKMADPGGVASIRPDNDAGGNDILLITYDVAIPAGRVISNTNLTSTASVTNFAAQDNGTNIATSISDAASIGLLQPTVAKTLVTTSDPATPTYFLLPNETATYDVTYSFTDGATNGVQLIDQLPTGTTGSYELISATVQSVGADLYTSTAAATHVSAATLGAATLSDSGADADTLNDRAVFSAGTVFKNGADGNIVVRYVVRGAAAGDGSTDVNTGTLTYTGNPSPPPSATAPIAFQPTQSLTKTVSATSFTGTGTSQGGAGRTAVPDLAIGESATFDLVATFSQGIFTGVVITDKLPTLNGTMSFTGTPTITVGGVAAAPVITYSDTNADGINDTATFTFGTITIPAGDHTVRISYQGVVPDIAVNQSGDQFDDTPATLTSSIGGPLTASVQLDVVAPLLSIAKDVTGSTTINQGGTVTYTIAVDHLAGSTENAYDLAIADALPAGLTNLQVTGVTTGGGLVLTPASFTTAGNSLGFVTPLDLTLGQSFVVTITGQATGAVGTTAINNAAVTYSTLDGPIAGERSTTISDPAASITIAAVNSPTQSFTKAVVATSLAATGSEQYRGSAPDLAIGETATFELVGTFSQASATNVVITDQLPLANGVMTFASMPTVTVGGVAVALPAGAITYTDTDGDGRNDHVVFNVGNIAFAGADHTVRIRYDAQVPNLPGNDAGDQLNSPATLTSGLGGPLNAAVDLDIVAPNVSIAKDAVGSGAVSSGSVATFTIAVGHAAGSSETAFDLSLADALPTGLTDLAVTGVTTGGGLVLSTANFTTVGNTLGLTGPIDLALGQSFVVTVTGKVSATTYGATITNTATTIYSTLPGNAPTIERTLTGSDPATIVVLPPAGVFGLDKAVTDTSSPDTGSAQVVVGVPDLSIGETAIFTLTIALPPGTEPLTLTDLLSNAQGTLQLVGTPVITPGTGVTIAGTTFTQPDVDGNGVPDLRWDFATVTAPIGGVITITYVARAIDVAANVGGHTLDLPATLTTPTGTLSDGERVDIVEPKLGITKTIATGTYDAGDTVNYTVVLTNSGTGPAYDVAIRDLLPTGLSYVAGSAKLSYHGVTSAVASPASVTVPNLAIGDSATLTYQAVIGANAVTGTTLTNTATATYDALLGLRPGSVNASANLALAATQGLTKTITATTDAETGIDKVRPTVTDLAIGETATLDLRVTLNEGITRNVVVTDTLNTANGVLTLVGTPQLLLNGNATTLPGTVQTIDSDGDGVVDQIRFNLGDVTLPANNNPNDNFLTIRYQGIVPSVAKNVGGNQLDLPATLTSALGTTGATAPVDIVEPVLLLTKTIPTDQPNDGLSTTYLITLSHAANSLNAASKIVITDLLPTGQLLSGTPVLVQGPAGASVSGATISVPHLGIGETVTIRLSTTLDPANATDASFINRAAVTYGGTSYTVGSRLFTGSAAAPAIIRTSTHLPDITPGQEQPYFGAAWNFYERQYRPIFPQIDPIYSGQADPGSSVSLNLTGSNGLSTGYGSAMVDAGGNWVIAMPSSTVNELLERSRFDDYFNSSRLFASPTGTLFRDRDLFGFSREDQVMSVGSTPSFDPQLARLAGSGGSAGLGAGFAPTWRSQTFTMESAIDVDGVFEHRAGEAVESLYDYLAAPEAAGLNRFNTAFLSAAALG